MTYSLDIKHIYHTEHIGVCSKIPSEESARLIEDYFSLGDEPFDICYQNGKIEVDELRDIEINGCDCPVTHEITITEVSK